MKVEIINDTDIRLIAESVEEMDLLDDWTYSDSVFKCTKYTTKKAFIDSVTLRHSQEDEYYHVARTILFGSRYNKTIE